ncbi:RPE4 domain protein [Rickettsia bellii str. RML An4]|uniref:RPE4 domain protein n=1 Tax=Rickettsia bellii str. RML An4 TaxID=1359193 RepID=A0A0F3QBI8_RICBE|nr:RPE4 domain protein [Rickettsia bellii str. RML An4]
MSPRDLFTGSRKKYIIFFIVFLDPVVKPRDDTVGVASPCNDVP